MPDLKALKTLLDQKVKFSESFKISISGKRIDNVNKDYCQPDFFYPECLCTSYDIDKIDRLENVLIRYAKNRYPTQCENPDKKDRFELVDQNDGSIMLYVAVRRPNGNYFK